MAAVLILLMIEIKMYKDGVVSSYLKFMHSSMKVCLSVGSQVIKEGHMDRWIHRHDGIISLSFLT
jgi:hypothetical protein